jgi:hypothetical protein
MPLWDDFTNTLKGAAKGFATGGIAGAVAGALKQAVPAAGSAVAPVAKAIGGQVAKTASGVGQGFQAAGFNLGAGPSTVVAKAGTQIGVSKFVEGLAPQSGAELTSQAQRAMTDIVTDKVTTKVAQVDPLLQAAVVANEKVFDPFVKRPIGTAALLADPTSPLYQKGEFGEGVQPSDVIEAFKRTEKVSLGQALSKSVINPMLHVTGLSDVVKSKGLDLDSVDLWDDESIQKNFVDNPLGRYMSGFTDALVGNVAIEVATRGAISGLKFSASKAGFSNKINLSDAQSLSNLDSLGDAHISGTERNVFGADLERLAVSKDVIEIEDILNPPFSAKDNPGYSRNPRLANLIKNTEDPSVIKDFILADKGYGPSIERLSQLKMNDDLWILGDAGREVSGNYLTTGQYPTYTFEQRQRIASAFDDAIAKNPKHQEIYNAFLRDEKVVGPITEDMAVRGIEPGQIDSVPRLFGSAYKPMEPIVGKELYIKGRELASKLRVGTITRDYSNVGPMTQKLIGRNGVTTALIKFSTTKMPRGIVSNSGVRPDDTLQEINAHFDDIPEFTRGDALIKVSPNYSVPASEYRRNFIARYLEAQTDAQRGIVLDELNKKLLVDVARTAGISKTKYVEDFADEAMGNINRYHNDLGNSYAMDPSGVVVRVDPETQRQIRNSTALLPVGEVSKRIKAAQKGKLGKGVINATDAADSLFELGNRAFSLATLVRPSYIGKNSIIEPALVSVLSLGSKATREMFPTYTNRVITENTQRAIAGIKKNKSLNKKQREQLANNYKLMSDQHNDAVYLLDDSVAEWVEFFAKPNGRSPVTRNDWSETVKRDLRAAERLVRQLEEDMRDAAPEFSNSFRDIPSLYNLTRRVEYLNSLKNPAFGADIANARATIAQVAGDINTLAPDLKAIDNAIATQYNDLEALVIQSGEKSRELEAMYSIAEGKVVKPAKRDTFVVSIPNGPKVEIPNFGNKQHFGSNYEAEVANTHTRQIELTGDKIFGKKVNMFNRKGPGDVTDVTNPLYFDELSFVVNNYMRGDILVDRILAGESRESILANWAGTRQAASYAAEFGKSSADIVAIVDNQFSYVNRYLPNIEAQTAAAAGEVTAPQLRKLLSDNPEMLTPIHPLDVTYSQPSGVTSFAETIDRLSTAAWTKLATPENKIRYAWASTRYKDIATEKIEALYANGFEVTNSTVNGIRQAAVAQTVKELENTFYSIRRPQRATFLARTVLAFPTASASGIYRYSRLAVKNPNRAAVFLNSYNSLYQTFGLDENGNPVKDARDAVSFIVPGTKEMGINAGKGLVLPKTSTMFMVNFAGAAYTVPLTLGAIYNLHKDTADITKKIINSTIGKLPGYSYEELFPYGIETSTGKQLTNTFTPAWMRNAIKYFTGDDSKTDFRNSLLSEYKYQMILWESGLGPKPTDKSVEKAARGKYGTKALWQFFSLIGSTPVINTYPASIFESLYFAKADEYAAMRDTNGKRLYTNSEAAQLAEDYLNTKVNLPKGTITAQVLRQTGTTKKFYVPATKEAVARIWEDHTDLFNELYTANKALPALMTADLPVGTDPQVKKFINDPNRTLPGGDKLISEFKSVDKLKAEIDNSALWKLYIQKKNEYDAAAKDAEYASYRSVPELVAGLKSYAKELATSSSAWAVAYDRFESGDDAVTFANGIKIVLNNDKYVKNIAKGSPFWKDAEQFVKIREGYEELYSLAPRGAKEDVQTQWLDYVDSFARISDPAFANLINRYFLADKLKSSSVKFKENK